MEVLQAGLAAVALAATAALVGARRSSRRLRERMRELEARMESATRVAARAAEQASAAERILLAKGIADEEDLEAAHRDFDARPRPGTAAGRDGDLH